VYASLKTRLTKGASLQPGQLYALSLGSNGYDYADWVPVSGSGTTTSFGILVGGYDGHLLYAPSPATLVATQTLYQARVE